MAEENLIQVGFELDIPGLQQDLTEAERLMQAGAVRMTQAQQAQQQEPPQMVQGGVAPPPPIPASAPAPRPTSSPQPTEAPDPVASAWEELQKIQEMSGRSPDVAMAALSGRGGLAGRVQKSLLTDPDNEEQYQQLLEAIKDLTKSTRERIKSTQDSDSGGPAAGILQFLRSNAMIGAAGQVGQQVMSGNLLGAGGSGLGALVGGLFGGPLGMQAGATLGGMAGNALGGFLSGASEAQDYSMLTADIGGRFGRIGETDEALSIANVRDMNTSGYSMQETAQLFDMLRERNVINRVDDDSRELVESLQELTRATGENTEALVQDFANYRTQGGRGDIDTYMATMIAGAVAVGMRENLGQYQEMVGSARSQLVYRSGVGDTDESGMRGVQGILSLMLGQQNRQADLLRDNPMMAQQLLGNLLGTGAARSGLGTDASLMQLAGINAAHTTEGYIGAGTQTQNALARQAFISQQFLRNSMGTMGFGSQEEFFAAAQQDPNLIQNMLTDQNPNTGQARALQTSLDVMIATTMGKDPTQVSSQDRQIAMQMLQAFGANQGNLTPETITGDGQSLAELIAESNQTEGDKAREAAAERHDEMMKLMSEFAPLLTSINEISTTILSAVNDVVDALQPLKRIESAIDWLSGRGAGGGASNLMSGGLLSGGAGGLGSTIGGIVGGLGTAAIPGAGMVTVAREATRQVVGEDALEIQGDILRRGARVLSGGLIGGNPEDPQNRLFRAGLRTVSGGLLGREPQQDRPPADAMFNDTPDMGVLARPGFDTFQFAHGDVVQAQMGGPSYSNSQSTVAPTIVVNLSVPPTGDYAWAEGAARSGARAGLDEFTQRWQNRDRGGARLNHSNY